VLAAVVGTVPCRAGCRGLPQTSERMVAPKPVRKAAVGLSNQLLGAAYWGMAVVMAAGVHAGRSAQDTHSSVEQ
jgi:hypothetical protein